MPQYTPFPYVYGEMEKKVTFVPSLTILNNALVLAPLLSITLQTIPNSLFVNLSNMPIPLNFPSFIRMI